MYTEIFVTYHYELEDVKTGDSGINAASSSVLDLVVFWIYQCSDLAVFWI